MNKKKKRIVVICIIVVLSLISLAIIVPLIMDWLIIGNSFPSNITNENWVSFFGGYFGAIIGGIVSMIGIVITILFTNQQNKKGRDANVRPYCYISVSRKPVLSKHIGQAEIHMTDMPLKNHRPVYNCYVNIKNIGLGPAIEFSLIVERLERQRKSFPVYLQHTRGDAENDIIDLQPGDAADIILYFQFEIDPLPPELLIPSDKPRREVLMKRCQIDSDYEIIVRIIFHDLYGNPFEQGIVVNAQDIMREEQDIICYKITHLKEDQNWYE